MRHSFDPDIAATVGVNAAVIYQNIVYWTEKNAANDKHFYDGRYWTYNSIAAFKQLFPYLSESQIRTALGKLEDVGLIVSGIFNKMGADRTKWYSPSCLICEKSQMDCEKSQTDLSEIANPSAKNRKPIPDIKPNNKPDQSARDVLDQRACDRFWEAYPEAGKVNFARSSLPIALGRHVARLRSVERLICAARNYAAAIRKQDTKPKALGNWLADPALVDQYAPPEAPYVDSPADPAALSHAQWRSYVGYFHRKGDWAGPGPRPDRDGCLAPQSVLDEFGFAKREGGAA
jgi:hypothetical protein